MSASDNYSFPQEPVRHRYPVSIRNAGLKTAAGLILKTLPYALTRFGILLAVSIAAILWATLAVGGGVWLADRVHGVVAMIWMVGHIAGATVLWRWVLRYALYIVKCGHIAVLTELIAHGKIRNGGEGQFTYGKRIVTERFKQVNVLFAVDVVVHGVVTSFNRTLNWVSDLIPVPGMNQLMAVVNAIVRAATTFIDETVFSYMLARGDENPWRGARDGVVYYGQNAKPILKTAIISVIIDKVSLVLVWIAALLPAIGLAYLFPPLRNGSVVLTVVAISALLAGCLRAAFLEPFLLTVVMSRFHTETAEQEISQEWALRLETAGGKFRQLTDKMGGWTRAEPVGQSEAGEPLMEGPSTASLNRREAPTSAAS